MRVISTTLGTDSPGPSSKHPYLERILRGVLPVANPDVEHRFKHVKLWWIEVDDNGVPNREIGFGSMNDLLVASPVGENTGFWTDSSMTFEEGNYPQVDHEAFEASWSRYVSIWHARRAGASDA